MSKKQMHPARRVFRKLLFITLGGSFVFLGGMIGMRVYYHDRPVEGIMQAATFKADVLQHKAYAHFIGNDVQDMMLAEDLLKLSLFSPIYTQGGMDILRDKADKGYAPAEARIAVLESKYPVLRSY